MRTDDLMRVYSMNPVSRVLFMPIVGLLFVADVFPITGPMRQLPILPMFAIFMGAALLSMRHDAKKRRHALVSHDIAREIAREKRGLLQITLGSAGVAIMTLVLQLAGSSHSGLALHPATLPWFRTAGVAACFALAVDSVLRLRRIMNL